MKVALRVHDGHYVQVDADGAVQATAPGLGAWEVLALLNHGSIEHPNSGDRVSLQAWNGRFLSATGGGGSGVVTTGDGARVSETFTIIKTSGSGQVVHGDVVHLRSQNGPYLTAEGGGDGPIVANRDNAREWETFRIEFVPARLVYLRSRSGQYVVAEGGGGGAVRADSSVAGPWETFSLRVPDGGTATPRSGDRVSLQTWNGSFLSAAGGGGGPVEANRTQAREWETFTIVKPSGSGEIAHRNHVHLRTPTGTFITAEGGGGGPITATRNQAREWETFTLELASEAPIPHARGLRVDRPLPWPRDPRTGVGTIWTVLVEYAEAPADPTVTTDVLRDALFDGERSLRRWVEANSRGAYTVANDGIFGLVRVPHSFSFYDGLNEVNRQTLWRDALNEAERTGIPLRDPTVRVMFDFSGVGASGSKRDVDVTTEAGTRYRGPVVGMGLFTRGNDVQGVDQISYPLLMHELTHALFGLPDRYSVRGPVRGDVVANRSRAGAWETFQIEKPGGTGEIAHGDLVNLKAHNGRYVVAEGGGGGLINADRAVPGPWETFGVSRPDGAGNLSHGDRVTLRAHDGRYVAAEDGGGRELVADRERAAEWETFILRRSGGAGSVRSGDSVTLEVSTGRFVVAEADGRTTNREHLDRGWTWVGSSGQGLGGDFDIMDEHQFRTVLMTAADRYRFDFAQGRILTPENRGCYSLRPAADGGDVLVLFDPLFPNEWYFVENRQARTHIDEVPANGLVLSWVKSDRQPTVISAARVRLPADYMLAPLTLDARGTFQRHERAPFTSQEVVPPRGDGQPSRFHLQTYTRSGELILCVV